MIRSIEMLERFTQILNEEAKSYGLLEQVKGLEDTLSCIDNTINKLKSEAASALANDHFLKYDQLKLQARDLKSDILNSKFGNSGNGVNQIFELLFYSQLFKCSKPEEKKNLEGIQINKDTGTDKPKGTQIDTDSPVTDTLGNNENVATNSDSNEGSENDAKRNKQTSENSKDTIHQLNERVKLLEDKSEKDKFIKEGQLKDLEEMRKLIETLENEISKQNELMIEESKDSLEKDKIIEISNLSKLQALYMHYFNQYHQFGSDSFLYFNMQYEKDRNFMSALIRQKVHLPELKELSIDDFRNSNGKLLIDFLAKCTPECLSVFKIIFSQENVLGQSIEKGLISVFPKVTKEIFIQGFSFYENDFNPIMNSSCQAESIEFQSCFIKICKNDYVKLKFGCETSKLEFLSLIDPVGRTSGGHGWTSNEEVLEIIIKAIYDSPVKESFKSLKVYDSSGTDKYVERFDTLELENVSISEESDSSHIIINFTK